jgi:hypothetical protein
MTIAADITAVNHTANRVRRAAQKQCSGMTRDHRADRDCYRFGDGSTITVTRQIVRIEEPQ